MLRIEMRQYGPPSVLVAVERPEPELADDDVLVRAALIGVNRADCFIRSGEWPQAGGFPYVPGLETAGTVERVGRSVRGFRPGDRVITMMQRLGGIHGERPGGYQELVAVPEHTLAAIPDGLDTESAALLGLPAVTAALALEVLDPKPGDRVLVQGGASAVGLCALQLLRGRGAVPIGTARQESKLSAMREAGAAQAVSTRDPRWAEQVGPVSGVFDLVGQATFAASVEQLVPSGRLVFVGGTSGAELSFAGWALMRPVTLTGYSSESLTAAELSRALGLVAGAVGAGFLKIPVAARYPLREAARAHADLEASTVTGRVVLDPGGT